MFVILAAAEERAESHEIIGVINKKKDLKALIDEKLLPVILQDAQDDLFDYTGVEEEDDGLTKEDRKTRDRMLAAKCAGGGAKSGTTDDDEINLDDI
jgi:hypothetical protein